VPTFFDQRSATRRCDWGPEAAVQLAPADVVIVVDVLSFSTCVDVAVGRGASVFPFPMKDATAESFAREHDAVLARAREAGGYSLSPASFREAPRGFRCVLPSPNGATTALRAAATGATVLAGCLRNATAVARAAQRMGTTVTVCPAGERWPDGSLRPAIEDWLGAGAILAQLGGEPSPEARAAIAAWNGVTSLLDVLAECGSGQELIGRGYPMDVELAAEYDASETVARLRDGAFIAS
jgi:2-phosphosulfolactate phosphatase